MRHLDITGFSLLELLIVVAVAGVLASVAYPAYTDSMRKGRRAQARVAIAEVLQQQERFMAQRNCYMAFDTAANGTVTAVENDECGIAVGMPVPFKPFVGDSAAASSHLVSAVVCSAGAASLALQECVRIEARPVLADPFAGTLWMTSAGENGCTGTDGVSRPSFCWP